MDDDFKERARKRANWPGSVDTEQTPAQLPTAAERVESMSQLALDAMEARGESLPVYTRATMPGRVISSK